MHALDIAFTPQGFQSLKLAGQSFARRDQFGRIRYFGDTDQTGKKEKEGGGVRKALLITGGVIGGLLVITTAALAVNPPFEDLRRRARE